MAFVVGLHFRVVFECKSHGMTEFVVYGMELLF